MSAEWAPKDVFICYKREERARVVQIAGSLRALGLTVWFDEALRSGTPFDEEINRELRSARGVLVCWSRGAVSSEWVRSEAMVASTRKAIVPVFLEPCELFPPFNLHHTEDLSDWSGQSDHRGWRKTLERLAELTGRGDLLTHPSAAHGADAVGPGGARLLDLPARVARGQSARRWWPVSVGGVGIALVALVTGWHLVGARASRLQESVAEAGYRTLDGGDLDGARRAFSSLESVRPALAYEGLAAVALRAGDLPTAQRLCGDVLRLEAARARCLFVQGDSSVMEGQLDRARVAYTAVLGLSSIGDAQRASAYNRLGRLAAEQRRNDEAIAAYTKAHEVDPANWESLSNLGALWRRQGRYADAVDALQTAATLRPGDQLIQVLLTESRTEAAASRDRERQQRVDLLVAQLIEQYRRGDVVSATRSQDEWTSRPLTLSLLPLDSQDPISFRDGEHEFLLIRLGQVLTKDTRVQLVERDVIGKVLEELRIGSSALAEPRTALRVGRLLSASLILVGAIRRVGSERHVTVRIIETETSALVASAAESFALSQSVADITQRFGGQLRERIRRAYPLRGRVVDVGGGQVTLNVGASAGAVPGQRLQLFREHPSGRRDVIGELEIVDVGEQRSHARPLTAQAAIAAGLKATQIY